MQLLELNLNKILLLDNYHFKDSSNNIDYLNRLTSIQTDLEIALSLLNSATSKIEKFHSFFHFEQSYFHLQLALIHLKEKQHEQMFEALKSAIFQDPLNIYAKQILAGDYQISHYQRPYNNFLNYLEFATEEEVKHSNDQGYWNDYAQYQQTQQNEILTEIIEKIRYHHLNYHQESAKLYINRAIIFYQLGQIDLAKNDLVKANNLDSNLAQKNYSVYNELRKELKIPIY